MLVSGAVAVVSGATMVEIEDGGMFSETSFKSEVVVEAVSLVTIGVASAVVSVLGVVVTILSVFVDCGSDVVCSVMGSSN
jgi:hypothetical protein